MKYFGAFIFLLITSLVIADQGLDYQEDEEEDAKDPTRVARVTSKGQVLTPLLGSNVYLPCETENVDKEVGESWVKNVGQTNQPLFLGDLKMDNINTHIHRHPNRTLEIRNIQQEDSGNYSCKLSDTQTVKYSVGVMAKPRIIKMEPSKPKLGLQKGMHATFECEASGFPPPVYSWRRKGKNLPNGMEVSMGPKLQLFHVDNDTHSGDYECVARNDMGVDIRSFQLFVSEVPVIEVEEREVNTELGRGAVLTCVVHAYPPAPLYWEHNNTAVDNNPRFYLLPPQADALGQRYSLRIDGVVKEDLGKYSCLAMNGNTAREHIYLTNVPTQPRFELEASEGNTAVIKGTFKSIADVSEIKSSFKRKGTDDDWTVLVSRNKDTYTVTYNLADVLAGEYEMQLCATNVHGSCYVSEKEDFTIKAAWFELEKDENSASVIRWTSRSIPKVKTIAFYYKRQDSNWMIAEKPDLETQSGNTYSVTYRLPDLCPGKYEARLAMKRDGMDEYVGTGIFTIEAAHFEVQYDKTNPSIVKWVSNGSFENERVLFWYRKNDKEPWKVLDKPYNQSQNELVFKLVDRSKGKYVAQLRATNNHCSYEVMGTGHFTVDSAASVISRISISLLLAPFALLLTRL